jgi:hypothetical protein
MSVPALRAESARNQANVEHAHEGYKHDEGRQNRISSGGDFHGDGLMGGNGRRDGLKIQIDIGTPASAASEDPRVPERQLSLTFFHPDFTVGSGVSPDRGAEKQ